MEVLQMDSFTTTYDHKFHEQNLIPLHLIKSTFGLNFKFHSSLDFDYSKIFTFASFDKQLFRNWRKFLPSCVNIPSSIISQPISYKRNIKINTKLNRVDEFAKQNIIFLYDLFITLSVNLFPMETNCQFNSQKLEKSTQIKSR